MCRKRFSTSGKLVLATALALSASGVAIADDTSTSRFGGDGYAYFSQPARVNTAVNTNWRQSHPNGLSERELQAAAASSMAMWQLPNGMGAGSAESNVAQTPSRATSLTRK